MTCNEPLYVIIKSSRLYLGGPGYSGPACLEANIEPGKIYESFEEASKDAKLLTKFNSIGFTVENFRK